MQQPSDRRVSHDRQMPSQTPTRSAAEASPPYAPRSRKSIPSVLEGGNTANISATPSPKFSKIAEDESPSLAPTRRALRSRFIDPQILDRPIEHPMGPRPQPPSPTRPKRENTSTPDKFGVPKSSSRSSRLFGPHLLGRKSDEKAQTTTSRAHTPLTKAAMTQTPTADDFFGPRMVSKAGRRVDTTLHRNTPGNDDSWASDTGSDITIKASFAANKPTGAHDNDVMTKDIE